MTPEPEAERSRAYSELPRAASSAKKPRWLPLAAAAMALVPALYVAGTLRRAPPSPGARSSQADVKIAPRPVPGPEPAPPSVPPTPGRAPAPTPPVSAVDGLDPGAASDVPAAQEPSAQTAPEQASETCQPWTAIETIAPRSIGRCENIITGPGPSDVFRTTIYAPTGKFFFRPKAGGHFVHTMTCSNEGKHTGSALYEEFDLHCARIGGRDVQKFKVTKSCTETTPCHSF